MTAKSRKRKFTQKRVEQPHFAITKIEDEAGVVLKFGRQECTCDKNKHHFTEEN